MPPVESPFLALACVLAWAGCHGASPGAPLPDGATVIPSSSLRQGQDGISLVFVRARGGLAGASAFDLGGLVVARQPQSTDTQLALAVSVPHGATLGARTLTFADAHGLVSVPDVVEVGAITSAPSGADTNAGTADAPFRTVKRAVQVAGKGDVIQLLDGVYDEAAGETWSYTLPESLTIVGQSRAATKLEGFVGDGGSAAGPLGFVAPAGLVIKRLTLGPFDVAVSATGAGALTLDDVGVRDARTAAVRADAPGVLVSVAGGTLSAVQDAILLGAHCTSCALEVNGTSIRAGLDDGYSIELSATATGSRVSLVDVDVHGDLLVSASDATLSVRSSSIGENGTAARALLNFGGRALDVTDSTITLEVDNFGINFHGEMLALSGVTVMGGHYGVYQLSGSSKVRGTKIRDYGFIGYYLAQGDLDLGTETDPGRNALSSGATGPAVFGLYVDDILHPVTCSNTTFNGVEPPPGTQAAGDETFAVPGEYFLNIGKAISFWTL